ncbi:putative replication factor C subunit 5 [Diplonema papillatum]|nr:putative replication factor C subunit 5 [Diplonema papillatum]
MSDLPWIEKYRPSSIDDILSHGEIIATLNRLIDQNQFPHLLLYGPAGTGKTSTVMAVARKIYGDRMRSNVLELNASDKRGIDVVRNVIKDFVSTKQLFGKPSSFKLVILDEADQMTNEAQASLRRIIEVYTTNARFCIICNYVNKILPAIQSRCTRFRFGPLPKKMVVQRLREVATAENLNFTSDALSAVHKLSGGDMRKCLNILQGTAMSAGEAPGGVGDVRMGAEVTEEDVYQATGSPSPKTMRGIVDTAVNRSLSEAFASIRLVLQDNGLALADVVRELQSWLMRMQLPETTRCWAIEKLSDIEYQLAFSCSDKLQLSGLISLLQLVRLSITEEKPISMLAIKGYMDE